MGYQRATGGYQRATGGYQRATGGYLGFGLPASPPPPAFARALPEKSPRLNMPGRGARLAAAAAAACEWFAPPLAPPKIAESTASRPCMARTRTKRAGLRT